MSFKAEMAKGLKSESEHKGTIQKIIDDARSGKVKELSDYFKLIAQDHLEEMPDYYTRLAAMEKGASRVKALKKIAGK